MTREEAIKIINCTSRAKVWRMDREKAIKILEDCKIFDSGGMGIKEIDECKKHNEAIGIAIEALKAEPVVRCNECRCRETDECPMHWEEWNVGEDGLDWINVHDYTKDDGFCDWGERREP